MITRREFLKTTFGLGIGLGLNLGQDFLEPAVASEFLTFEEAFPGPMAKTIISKGITYGYMTQAESRGGIYGGQMIYISPDGGKRWFNSNFNDMSLDPNTGVRPAVTVIDAVVGQSGRVYFEVIPSTSDFTNFKASAQYPTKNAKSYRDLNHGFIANPGVIEIEVANASPSLSVAGQLGPAASFYGKNSSANRLEFTKLVNEYESKIK